MTQQFWTKVTSGESLSIPVIVIVAAITVACSGSPLAPMPLAPSALPSSTASVETGDGIDETGDGIDPWGTLDKGKDKGKDGKREDDKGRNGDSDDDEREGPSTSLVEIEGVVGALVSGNCPAKSFNVGMRPVVTNDATQWRGGACAGIVPGAEVEVRGTRQADGRILATRIEFEADDVDDKDDADMPQVELEGPIVGTVTGTCPAVTFTIGTTKVTTSMSTRFRDGVCADAKTGTVVEVRGTRAADGTLNATSVNFEDEDDDDADDDEEDEGRNPHDGNGPFEGTVSRFRGTCPAVTFNLKGMNIVVSATTTYVGGTCATLRPNVKVIVAGTRGTERRTINATSITITRTH